MKPLNQWDFFNPALAALHNCPVPTVAKVNGVAAGGGMGLALACDVTIAVRSSFFVATFWTSRLGMSSRFGLNLESPETSG